MDSPLPDGNAVVSATQGSQHPSPTPGPEGGEDLGAQPSTYVTASGKLIAKELLFAPNGCFLPGHPKLPGSGRPEIRPLKKAILQYIEENEEILPALVVSAFEQAHTKSEYFNSIRDIIDGKPAQEIAANVSLFDGLAERLASAKQQFEEGK